MSAISYLRVSTDEQAISGLGLEAQRAAIAAAAERLGLKLGGEHVDRGYSGSLAPLQRPGLTTAIAELAQGDVLLVAKRDRLSRDAIDLGMLERELGDRGVRIVSAAGEGTGSNEPMDVFLRRILDAVGELERNMGIARTRAALGAKRARGERSGSIPFGFAVGVDGKLVEDREEQVALLLMTTHRAAGESFRAIARELTRRGYKPRGKAWHPQGVRSILGTVARRS